MTHAHGGLKDLRVHAQPQALHRRPHRPDHHWRREMRIRRRGPCGVVLFRAQEAAHLAGNLRPVAARIGMEDIGERAPAAVARQKGLFSFVGCAALILDEPQGADCRDVVAGFFFQSALPDPVRFRDPEVARRDLRGLLRFEEFGRDGCGVSRGLVSPGGSAHSSRAISHAAW